MERFMSVGFCRKDERALWNAVAHDARAGRGMWVSTRIEVVRIVSGEGGGGSGVEGLLKDCEGAGMAGVWVAARDGCEV